MTLYRKATNSFTSGIIGERAWGRNDLDQIAAGARRISGFEVLPTGGIVTLPSTKVVTLTYYKRDLVGAVSWTGEVAPRDVVQYEPTPTYPDGLIIALFETPDLATGEEVYSVAAFEPDGTASYNFTASAISDTTSLINYTTGTFRDNTFIQTGDIMIFCYTSGEHEPDVLQIEEALFSSYSIISLDSWSGFYVQGKPVGFATVPYNTTNMSTTTLTPSGNNITASLAIFDKDEDYYIGKYIRLEYPAATTIAKIASVTDTSTVVVSWETTAATAVTDDWATSVFGGTDQPNSMALKGNRLVFGGGSVGNAVAYASRSENIFFFMQERLTQAADLASDVEGLYFYGTDLLATDPFGLTLSVRSGYATTNAVASLGTALLMFTTGGIFSVNSSTGLFIRDDLEPSTISEIATANVIPATTRNSVVFAGENGHIYSISYTEEGSGFDVQNISILRGEFDSITSITNVGDDTKFIINHADGVSYLRNDSSLGILAFTEAEIGRTIHKSIKRSNETIGYLITDEDNEGEYFYVEEDSDTSFRLQAYSTADSSALGVLTIPTMYQSDTIAIFESSSDTYVGTYDSVAEVTGLTASTQYTLGVISECILETMPPMVAGESGSGLDMLGRIDRVHVRLRETTAGEIGTDEDRLDTLVGTYDPDYTGLKRISLTCGQDEENTIIIKQSSPYNMEITSLVTRGQVLE